MIASNDNSGPLRILSVANTPADPNSGAAGTVFQTNVALREQGHHVDEIWADDLGPRRIAHGNLHSLIEQPRRYARAIGKALESTDYDVVIAQQPQSWMAARDHKRANRKCLFLTMSQGVETRIWTVLQHFRDQTGVRASRFPHRLLTQPLQRLLARQWQLVAKYSDGIVVQHTQDQEYLCSQLGLSKSRVHIAYSGLSPAFLARPAAPMNPERRFRLLFVGQHAFYKGVHCLGEIVTTVLRRFPRASMTWVCSSVDHDRAAQLFATDVRDRIQMVGWGTQDQLIDVLDSHGIFIFPTLAEGFAKAPLEAMSRGLAVVASDCCGMRDYVAPGTGFLCEVGNATAFVETITGLLPQQESQATASRSESPIRLQTDVDHLAAIAAKATSSAAHYTWDRSASGLAEFAHARIKSKQAASEGRR